MLSLGIIVQCSKSHCTNWQLWLFYGDSGRSVLVAYPHVSPWWGVLSVHPHLLTGMELSSLGMLCSPRAMGVAEWVSCEGSGESVGSAGRVLLIKDAKGPATLLYEEHVVQRGWGGIICAIAKLWKLFPGAGHSSKERIPSFSLVCSGGAWAAEALPCYVCESLTRFECRLSFAVRCRHSSAGRMQTRCVVSPFLGHMVSAPAPHITAQPGLWIRPICWVPESRQGSPRHNRAMWQKYTMEKRRAFPLPPPLGTNHAEQCWLLCKILVLLYKIWASAYGPLSQTCLLHWSINLCLWSAVNNSRLQA